MLNFCLLTCDRITWHVITTGHINNLKLLKLLFSFCTEYLPAKKCSCSTCSLTCINVNLRYQVMFIG